MFSNMKQTFYHVRDSLIKHRWLLTAELIWMIVCTFWTVSEQKMRTLPGWAMKSTYLDRYQSSSL